MAVTRNYLLFFAVALVAVSVFLIVFYQGEKAALTNKGSGFERVPLGETTDLFSIGVADFQRDGNYDIFTTNHAFAALYLVNKGRADFTESRKVIGLSSNIDFPNAEIATIPPNISSPGLYLYWVNGEFEIVSFELDLTTPARLSFSLNGGLVPEISGEMRIVRHDDTYGAEFPANLELEISGDGRLKLRSLRWAVNGSLVNVTNIDPEHIFVGQQAIPANTNEIVLTPGADRHGIVWADMNDDGVQDAYFVDGGESGLMRRARPYVVAFGTQEGKFENHQQIDGLIQDLCPSRQVLASDINDDDWLDFHVVCGRVGGPRSDFPNEQFVSQRPGVYANQSADFGLDLPGPGKAMWFDHNHDGRPELVWATHGVLEIYASNGTKFKRILHHEHQANVRQIVLGNLDDDVAPEIFVVATSGESLIIDSDTDQFKVIKATAWGLPAQSECGVIFDIDNDGVGEIFTLPKGLYRRSTPEAFASTGLMASGDYPAFCLSFDADNDGASDLLVALPATDTIWVRVLRKIRRGYEKYLYKGQYQGRIFNPTRWDISLYRNVNTESLGNFLTVDLAGKSGNRDGIGAIVTLTTGERKLVKRVGDTEGSTSSTGHYRLHFGLGVSNEIESLLVRWPDGTEQSLHPVPDINQLITITYP